MLSDARTLWQSASSAIASFNENISTALDNLDKDASEEDKLAMEQIQKDLHEYKKLLDDAQMQHFELSKQSRMLLAEKDAELSYWKQLAQKEGHSVGDGEQTSLQVVKLQAEKAAIEESLKEVQEQLRSSLREKNDYDMLLKNYNSLSNRFETVKADLTSLKSDGDAKDKQKSDTIENLVQEYSTLAAEAELMQTQANKRSAELKKENEVLVTKIQALEHSISELADRTVARSEVTSQASVSTPSTPDRSISDGGGLELREVRAKVVNLQYDLKEKDTEIAKLKAALESQGQNSSSAVSDAAPINNLVSDHSSCQAEISNLGKDVARLQVEKREAEEAGKGYMEQSKKLQREMELLRQQVADRDSASTADSSNALTLLEAQLRAAEEKLAAAIEDSKSEKAIMEKQFEEKLASVIAHNSAKATAENEQLSQNLAAKEASLTAVYEEKLAQLEKQLEEKEKSLEGVVAANAAEIEKLKKDLNDILTTNADSSSNSAAIVAMKDAELAKLNAELDAARKSAADELSLMNDALVDSQNKENELNASIEDYQKKMKDLVSDHEKALQLAQSSSSSSLQEQIAKTVTDEREKAAAELKKLEESLMSQIALLEQEKIVLVNELAAVREEAEQQLVTQKEKLVEEQRLEIQRVNETLAIDKASALESAQQIASQELQEALNLQKISLQKDFDQALLAQQQLLNEELVTAVASARAEEQETKARALENASNDHAAKLVSELSLLETSKEQEKQSALAKLSAEKDDAHAAIIKSLEEESAKATAAMVQSHEEKVLALQQDITKLQAALTEVEDKYKAITKEALAALEAKKEAEKSAALSNLRQELQGLVDKAYAERDEHLANYTKERKLRKKIHNKLLEIQGNIRVICRVRPILEVERKSGEDVDVTEFINDEELTIQRDAQTKTRYEYDRVFAPGSTQEEVFEAVQPLCISVLDGFNVCIFAYGQTGSGKTFTMEGYGTDYGVTPRAINELFNHTENLKGEWSYTMTLSMLEIYNETIRDLLDNPTSGKKEKLDIRQTAEGNQVVGLTECQISSMEQVRELMRQGQANRAVGSHDMNEHSSRSHSILTVVCRGQNHIDGSTTYGKLHLIDLAGSERVGKTDASGDRLKEAQNINKSLSALGDVINALGNKKSSHIPYRNSKLTFLLQDSLGGNSKVLTFVNISPAVYNVGETICSLNFASRCRSTELGQAKKQDGSVGNTAARKAGSSNTLLTDNMPGATPRRAPVSQLSPSGSMSSLKR